MGDKFMHIVNLLFGRAPIPLRAVAGCSLAQRTSHVTVNIIGIMYRTGHAASASRPFLRCVPSTFSRPASSLARTSLLKQQKVPNLKLRRQSKTGLILYKPFSVSLQRYATQPGNPFDKIDKKHEEVVEHEKLEPHPEEVSTTSSVHEVFHEKGVEEGEKEEDMLAGVKADLVGL